MNDQPRLLTRFDDVFYAFDKPAGMAVHQNSEDIPDLVSWIKQQRSLPQKLRPGHRLDRATSGIVLCGAGRKARAQIAKWVEDLAHNTYLALVAGAPLEDQGQFAAPLPDDRRKRLLEADTRYEVKQRFDGFTLLTLDLVTGRKHQLRRHLADAGLPIVGDTRYGPKRPKRVPDFPGRLWLHASTIQIGERMIQAPLPTALQVHLERMACPVSEKA
jgi:23S rRNA-/tRNA-specific pseudouridylate synthase